MLPLENGANEEPWTLGIDENLWLPCTSRQRKRSGDQLRAEPRPSPRLFGRRPDRHDQLKHYLWSDGSPVTTRDIQFFFNLYKW